MTKIRELTLDAAQPAVIVSIMAADRETVLARARRIVQSGADIAEWRLDQLKDLTGAPEILPELRATLGDLPLLTTVRSQAEGGLAALEAAELVQLTDELCTSGLVDAVDVEISHSGAADAQASAARHRVPVIGSRHLLDQCPSADELVAIFEQIASQDVAVCKLAVTATSAIDVANLLGACARASGQLNQPLIAIAMGDRGRITRVAGQVFGSVATFASLDGEASAPGQLDVVSLRQALTLFS